MARRSTGDPPQSLLALKKLVTVTVQLLKEREHEILVSPTGLLADGVYLPLEECQIVKRNHHNVIVLSLPRALAEEKHLI